MSGLLGSSLTGKLIAILILCLGLATGCATVVTWPNEGGSGSGDPFIDPCAEIMARGMIYAHAQLAPASALIWNLPVGTDRLVWDKVQRRMPEGARYMTPEDTTAWSMKQLRLDGGKAQVDVVYKTSQGVWQMVTVHFEGALGTTYRPVYLQRWMVPVDAPACGSVGASAETAQTQAASPVPAASAAPAVTDAEETK